jgi:hypothetical protein
MFARFTISLACAGISCLKWVMISGSKRWDKLGQTSVLNFEVIIGISIYLDSKT